MMGVLSAGLTPLIVGPLTLLAVAALAWIIGRSRPALETSHGGEIRPEKISAGVTVVLGAGFCFASLFALFDHQWLAGAALFIFGFPISLFMIPSLTNFHNVQWTAEFVEGPTSTFGPTLGLKRDRLEWSDIVKAGKTATGYWFVESTDGRRVYWSYLYKGYRSFETFLKLKCPNLTLP